eukprot:4384138-Amphidinium_carterae.1
MAWVTSHIEGNARQFNSECTCEGTQHHQQTEYSSTWVCCAICLRAGALGDEPPRVMGGGLGHVSTHPTRVGTLGTVINGWVTISTAHA